MAAVYLILKVIFVILAGVMILAIMLRKGEGGGVAAAFGFGGESAFGVKGAQTLDKVIAVIAIAFVLLTVAINKMRPESRVLQGAATTTESPK